MSIGIVICIALALAMDAFAVSIACAAYLGQLTGRQKFRLSFHFGFFQFLMPLIGWFAGKHIVHYVEFYDRWIAFGILAIIGIKMITDANHPEVQRINKDVTRGFSLVVLSVATSIDALAVGFSLGIIKSQIFIPAVIIGIVASGMSLIGISIGSFLSSKFGNKVSIFGGVILILIGIHILLEHLNII